MLLITQLGHFWFPANRGVGTVAISPDANGVTLVQPLISLDDKILHLIYAITQSYISFQLTLMIPFYLSFHISNSEMVPEFNG